LDILQFKNQGGVIMTNEKMTIAKALSELKVLGNRITAEIRSATFCNVSKHTMRTLNGKNITDVKAEMQGSYDKIVALINRNNAIKKAVNKANASTIVSIGGEQMTVAEAIYMKQTGIDYMKALLNTMATQYTNTQSLLQNNNGEKLTKACETYIIGLYGTNSSNNTISDEMVEIINAARAKYIDENTFDLIEGIDTKKAIEDLKNKIDAFEAEVDAAITVANATTEIEINY
jgi:hypothetical protein